MADVVQGKVWLTDPTKERCTDVQEVTLAFTVHRERVPGFHPLLENTSHDQEVTRLWASEDLVFDVPAGVRVDYAGAWVAGHTFHAPLPWPESFDSSGSYTLTNLKLQATERVEEG